MGKVVLIAKDTGTKVENRDASKCQIFKTPKQRRQRACHLSQPPGSAVISGAWWCICELFKHLLSHEAESWFLRWATSSGVGRILWMGVTILTSKTMVSSFAVGWYEPQGLPMNEPESSYSSRCCAPQLAMLLSEQLSSPSGSGGGGGSELRTPQDSVQQNSCLLC